MPVKFIGRVTDFRGKSLMAILCRLKNFGGGRMVYRHTFNARYAEPSYYVITGVDADMSDPTLKEPSDKIKAKAYGMKVFRGESHGKREIRTSYKTDWRLVPRADEHKFLNWTGEQRPCSVVPDTAPLTPLLRHIWMRDEAAKQKDNPSYVMQSPPVVDTMIKTGPNNRAMKKSDDDIISELLSS